MPPRLALLAGLCFAAMANAHVASNSFLQLKVAGDHVEGSLEVSLRDAELGMGLDANRDAKVSWGEVRNAQVPLATYIESHLRLSGPDGNCDLKFGAVKISDRVDGAYVWQPMTATCPGRVQQLAIEYRLLDEEDPSHRGLLSLTAHGVTQSAVLGGARILRQFDLARPSAWNAFREYLQAGIGHIWSGIDHLLFLLSLLLPAVLLRRENHWQAQPAVLPAFLNIVQVVTAFTFAHSITLALAAFELVHIPGRLTESVIAASIIVAALNNVMPWVTHARWRIAFAFGLLHGFGFASVLTEMGLPAGARITCLLAFNLGVEAGQLAVVLLVMPLAYVLRQTAIYRLGVLPWGSLAIAGLASVWLVQRALG
jgi:hypothetical protein